MVLSLLPICLPAILTRLGSKGWRGLPKHGSRTVLSSLALLEAAPVSSGPESFRGLCGVFDGTSCNGEWACLWFAAPLQMLTLQGSPFHGLLLLWSQLPYALTSWVGSKMASGPPAGPWETLIHFLPRWTSPNPTACPFLPFSEPISAFRICKWESEIWLMCPFDTRETCQDSLN